MKKIVSIMLIMSCTSAFADAPEKVKVKEIKAYLETIDKDSTCMDEYIKRRNQMIFKVSATPLTLAAGTAVGIFAGGAVGAGAAYAVGVQDSWAGLGYVVGGGMLGGAGGLIGMSASTTSAITALTNSDLILKTLGEQYLGRDGVKSDKLHAKYIKKSKTDISKEEFISRLLAADANGTLCDGTMVKQPRIRIGAKLKYKIAKIKDLAREL